MTDNKVIVFGSSGHAKSIAMVLELLNYEIIGFIDSYLPKGTKVLKYNTLGDETMLINCRKEFNTNNVVIGVGDLYNRQKILQKIKTLNSDISYPCIISPKATVANYTKIGQGTVILNNSFVNVESIIGDFCVINTGCIIEHNTTIGDFCSISPGTNIGGNVTILSNTFIGSSTTVIQKRKIGKNSVVGAGAVVNKDIPDNVLAVGIPVKIKKENYFNNNIFK
jgi:sugar O-acyltransferase (sialic acid O-acetyltransferase NeuD family)